MKLHENPPPEMKSWLRSCVWVWFRQRLRVQYNEGRNKRGKGEQFPERRITAGGSEWLCGEPKSPNNATSIFFNAVHLFAKELKCEHEGGKLASCPGRRLTSLCPWIQRNVKRTKCKHSRCGSDPVNDWEMTCLRWWRCSPRVSCTPFVI